MTEPQPQRPSDEELARIEEESARAFRAGSSWAGTPSRASTEGERGNRVTGEDPSQADQERDEMTSKTLNATSGDLDSETKAEARGHKRGRTFTNEDRAKAAQVRAEKARERQAEADHAARTVHERAAVALAKLTQRQLDDAVQAMAREAAAGKVQAFKALLDYLKLAAIQEEEEEADMTPEQRAEAMAEIERWMQPGTITPHIESRAHEPDRPESSDTPTHP